VGIVSYHSLPRFLNDPENEDWLDNVEYVVADECHYFTSDSSFNDLTEWHLKLITKHFKRAIRVYMTGTSWDVLRPIADAEMAIKYDKERACKVHLDREIIRYHWEQDHSHVDLRFFRDLEEIKQLILGNPNEKYMIFVDSRDSGRALADDLGKNRATYLDAESKGTKEMTKLLKEQTFDRQVLVTTKVLDCGINLWDNRLRHIVTVTDDRVSMLQMLGRKRRKPGERVNLYVCDMDLKLIAKRYRDGQELLAALREYQEGDSEVHHQMARSCWRSEDRKYRIYFRITDWSIVPNEVAFWALRRKDYFYRKLLEGHTTFRGEVCKWLGKTQEPEKIPDDELNAFCEAHLGQELNEEEIVMVRKRIVKTAEAKGFKEQQPTRVDTLGTEALNNRLSKVESPYRFEKKRWVILKEEKCDV
jgi:superfamily II DNA or RNA helicase